MFGKDCLILRLGQYRGCSSYVALNQKQIKYLWPEFVKEWQVAWEQGKTKHFIQSSDNLIPIEILEAPSLDGKLFFFSGQLDKMTLKISPGRFQYFLDCGDSKCTFVTGESFLWVKAWERGYKIHKIVSIANKNLIREIKLLRLPYQISKNSFLCKLFFRVLSLKS